MKPDRSRWQRVAIRDRIVAYVAEHGAVRMTWIRDDLGLTSGSAAGTLTWLVQHGRLARPARGVYTLPGARAEIPPLTADYGDVSGRNRAVWAGLDEQERQRRIGALNTDVSGRMTRTWAGLSTEDRNRRLAALQRGHRAWRDKASPDDAGQPETNAGKAGQ